MRNFGEGKKQCEKKHAKSGGLGGFAPQGRFWEMAKIFKKRVFPKKTCENLGKEKNHAKKTMRVQNKKKHYAEYIIKNESG